MWLLYFLAGCILPLAFAPINAWPIAIISLYVFCKLITQVSIKHVFWHGLLFGIGYFSVGVSWVFISIHDYANTNVTLAIIITGIFVLILALYIAITAVVSKYLSNLFKSSIKYNSIIILPSTWLMLEILRSWLFTGFPWVLIGYSQINSPLIGYAPIVSVYGISFLTLVTSSIIYHVITNKSYILLTIVLIIWLFGWHINKINWTNPVNNLPINLSMIQGNIQPNNKFLLEDPYKTNWDLYSKPAIQQFKQGINLVIWPESSLTVPLPYSKSFIQNLDNIAKQYNATIILGLPIKVTNREKYHNSILAIGANHARYGKTKLVPFGEYLPLSKYLRGIINLFAIPMSDFIPAAIQQNAFNLKDYVLLPLICYEMAYPEFVRSKIEKYSVNAIVTISEDGWFGNSWGPHQHLDIARMRAIETGRYVLRATTSGISAVIHPQGKVLAKSPQFKKHILTSKFYSYTNSTPWVSFGAYPWLLLLGILNFLTLRICSVKNHQ